MVENRLARNDDKFSFEPNFERDISKIPQTSERLFAMAQAAEEQAKTATKEAANALYDAANYFKIYANLKFLHEEAIKRNQVRERSLTSDNKPVPSAVLKKQTSGGPGQEVVSRYLKDRSLESTTNAMTNNKITDAEVNNQTRHLLLHIAEILPNNDPGKESLRRAAEYLKYMKDLGGMEEIYKKKNK